MIQRVQTIFLLLSSFSISLFYILPFGKVECKDLKLVDISILGAYFDKNGVEEFYSLLPLLILLSVIVLISWITIFLFKHRMIQIRLSVFNSIMQLGSIALMFYFLNNAATTYGIDYHTSILIVMPIVAAILNVLAIRYIARDEALVRSINRMR